MKKQLKKALAIVCAVAFVFTGITYTPVNAAVSPVIVVAEAGTDGVDGTAGIWEYTVLPGKGDAPYYYTWDVTATIKNYDVANGFNVTLDKYCWAGSFYKITDMKDSLKDSDGNALLEGVNYNLTVKITETPDGSTHTPISVSTSGGATDMANVTKRSTGEQLVWTGEVTPGSDPFKLNIGYGNNNGSSGLEGQAGKFTVDSVALEKADDFTPVPSNEKNYRPDDDEDNPWALTATWLPDDDHSDGDQGSYGRLSYKVDGEPEDIDSTYVRIDSPGHDDASTGVDQSDPDKWWWWTSGNIPDAFANLTEGKTYEGTINLEYTAPENPQEEYSPKLRVIANGVVKTVDISTGTNQIAIDEFDYDGSTNKIEFNFDLLEKGSIIQITSIDLDDVGGDWTRVPDEDTDFEIPVQYDSPFTTSHKVTHNWKIFAGDWGGEGCKLYYDNDLQDLTDPLKIKIGAGNRWDPACAQIKLTNADAYQELDPYTNYYMDYKFYSTGAGTIHMTHEGYEPDKPERIDVTPGWNHYRSIFTVLPSSEAGKNVYLSLSYATYEFDENGQIVQEEDAEGHLVNKIIKDGDPLPVNTVLSDFSVSYSQKDDDDWVLVTDSREQSHQNIDNIVVDQDQYPLLRAYANSWNKGRMSYKAGYNADGKNDVAKMGIRLDKTAGSQIKNYVFDDSWGLNLQIPNKSFYNRKDTNGEDLVSGKTYKLRFYLDVDLPANTSMPTDTSGIILTQQGYRENQYARYNIGGTTGTKITKDDLYMVNGTFTPKNGSVDDAYIAYEGAKTGGIEFTYDASMNDRTRDYDGEPFSVMVDFSEFPEGTIIKGIDWEFYRAGYNVYIDGTRANEDAVTEDPGSSYTFPTNSTPGFENAVKFVDPNDPTVEYQLGQTVTFDDFNGEDIVVNTVRDETTGVEIRQGSTTGKLLKEDRVQPGEQYTLPEIQGIDHYVYDNQEYDAGDKVGPFTDDPAIIVAIPTATHTVTIVDADNPGTTLKTVTDVAHNSYYQLPNLLPDYDVDYYVYDNDTWAIGEMIGPITEDVTVEAVLVPYHEITIDGDHYTYVRDGGSFTFPTGDTAAKIGYIEVDGEDVYSPGAEVDNIYEDRDYLSIDEMTITPKPGAAIYLKENEEEDNRRGIAFGAEFRLFTQKGDVINYSEYENVYKSSCFKLGTIITTQDRFVDYFDETLDLAQVKKAQDEGHADYIFNINNNSTFRDAEYTGSDEYAEYRAGIKNMNDFNIPRNFIARSYGYVETTDGAVTNVVYANYSDIRSIKQTANILRAKTAYYESLVPWKQKVVDECADYEG